ncbi:carbohydrate binding family 9 domain-containing protein [candidate division KSB1 bacterium]|nr:carbohydrate binding family 9 domain-containing protein [candidate division KSB1 bacterium]
MSREKFMQRNHVGYVSIIIFLINEYFLIAAPLQAIDTLLPSETKVLPKIDGVIEEPLWQSCRIDTFFITYNPAFGDTLAQHTVIHLSYDAEHLYFAFECFDDEPDKIKTSISQRDRIFSDDWIGFSLDALGNRQSSYDFFVNPNGIQADILNTTSGEDVAPDWVWESAGRLIENGYQVEISIPLRSIRFAGGEESVMGLLFWRKVSRFGKSGAFPMIAPGQSSLAARVPVLYNNLRHKRQIELLPSFTSSSQAAQMTPHIWEKADIEKNLGFSAKLAVSSSTTLDATYHPDFSQVESDAYQVEVNQRYPIFYDEKRPFFMEAGGLFNVAATGGDNMMVTAVHTRKIVDPNIGGRITGSVGRSSFGVLASDDASPGQSLSDEGNALQEKTAQFFIARYKYSFGGDNYAGLIYGGQELDHGYNRVGGVDFKYRLNEQHNFGLAFLSSASKEPFDSKKVDGNASMFNYFYGSKKLGIWTSLERFDPGFNMETAFYQRTGFSRATVYLGPNFYPDEKKQAWIRRINPFVFTYLLHDLETQQDDFLLVLALRSFWTRQGMLRFDYIALKEYWKIQSFNQYLWRAMANAQATNWLNFNACISQGKTIYYDEENPYLGDDLSYSLGLTLQPNTKFTQSFDLYHETFCEPVSGRKEYEINIINSRTTYQFNKYFFLRAIFRYQDYDKKLLTDFLASFTFIPGTVLYIGYGSLYEQKYWQENEWIDNSGRHIESIRSFFFKASYLWRI